MTIQQALFGRDIWGRTVALIDDIYWQYRINRTPPVRVEGTSFQTRPELQERGKQVLFLFLRGKKSCLIFWVGGNVRIPRPLLRWSPSCSFCSLDLFKQKTRWFFFFFLELALFMLKMHTNSYYANEEVAQNMTVPNAERGICHVGAPGDTTEGVFRRTPCLRRDTRVTPAQSRLQWKLARKYSPRTRGSRWNVSSRRKLYHCQKSSQMCVWKALKHFLYAFI